jgi:hypothetical protein
MPAKKYSVEQIVAKLREHEKLQGQGLAIPQACKRIGISDQTFYRWRLKSQRIPNVTKGVFTDPALSGCLATWTPQASSPTYKHWSILCTGSTGDILAKYANPDPKQPDLRKFAKNPNFPPDAFAQGIP